MRYLRFNQVCQDCCSGIVKTHLYSERGNRTFHLTLDAEEHVLNVEFPEAMPNTNFIALTGATDIEDFGEAQIVEKFGVSVFGDMHDEAMLLWTKKTTAELDGRPEVREYLEKCFRRSKLSLVPSEG